LRLTRYKRRRLLSKRNVTRMTANSHKTASQPLDIARQRRTFLTPERLPAKASASLGDGA